MFETIAVAPPDAILGLNEAFKNDPNPQKINLTVGVYKDDSGTTPILKTVKLAEERMLSGETTKGYLGIDGDPSYIGVVRDLLFGTDHEIVQSQRSATLQTPGGTGALRVAGDLIKTKLPGAAIWCSKPTWANHPSVFNSAGLTVNSYDYLDASGTGLDFEAMLKSLQQIPKRDAVCLHACCHNPTGVDPTNEQWEQIASVIVERDLLPIVDCAYQGFGAGLEEDVVGLRSLCQPGRELMICNSFSKNFGLYGERVGGLTIVAADQETAKTVLSNAKVCVRTNYSNPPKHGGLIVSTILSDAELRQQWEVELAQMRDRIAEMRQLFVDKMKERTTAQDFSFIANQSGMFSFSGLNPVQVDQLRSEHSIYIVGSGRINVAGMTRENIDTLCDAIAQVL